MKKSIILSGIFFISAYICSAQELSKFQVELQGSDVVVHYALNSPNADGLYEIELYSSHNNFNAPVKMVSGDVGDEIRSGSDKKVVWTAAAELGSTFKDRLSVELRARYYVPFVKIIKPVDASSALQRGKVSGIAKLHRGKISNIEWSGGSSSTAIRIDLLKGGVRLQTLGTTANTGLYSWHIPSNTKIGNDYSLMLTDSRNAEDAVKTEVFSIRPKIATGIKIGAFLALSAIGATTYLLAPEKTTISEIPDPPLPRDN